MLTERKVIFKLLATKFNLEIVNLRNIYTIQLSTLEFLNRGNLHLFLKSDQVFLKVDFWLI